MRRDLAGHGRLSRSGPEISPGRWGGGDRPRRGRFLGTRVGRFQHIHVTCRLSEEWMDGRRQQCQRAMVLVEWKQSCIDHQAMEEG